MPKLGVWELVIILLIVLLIFGAARLPEIGSALGKGLRGFKNTISGKDEEKPTENLSTEGKKNEHIPRA
jgi:sec-independent protein translocase protein TatA